jgi:hypothetical protein
MPKKNKNLTTIGDVSYQRLFDWSGGMNDAVDPALLNDNESPIFENAALDQKGTLYPRRGSEERYPTDIASAPVTGIGSYYKSDGTSRLLIGAGSSLYTDKPHVIDVFDAKAEWDLGTVTGLASTSAVVGSVKNSGTPANLTQATDTQAQWDTGTKTQVESTSGGSIQLQVRRNPLSITKTSKADWDAHTQVSTQSVYFTGSVGLGYA